jgi:hypothetical protein
VHRFFHRFLYKYQLVGWVRPLPGSSLHAIVPRRIDFATARYTIRVLIWARKDGGQGANLHSVNRTPG